MEVFNLIKFFFNLYLLHEQTLLYLMALLMIAVAFGNIVLLWYIEAPYGRYSSSRWGPPINAKVAWCIQEAPAFIVPLVLIVSCETKSTNGLYMLLCFVSFYGYRLDSFLLIVRASACKKNYLQT